MHLKKSWHFSTINKLNCVGIFSGLATAAVATIWAIYLDSFIHNAAYVGFLAAIFTIVGIVSYIFLTPIIEKSKKANLYSIAILIYIIAYLLFALLPFIWAIIILGIIISMVGSLRITLFGIIYRDKSKDKDVSKNEGLIYTLTNISWFVSPIFAGFLANKYGIKSVFFFAAIIFLITSIILRFSEIKDNRKTKRLNKNSLKVFLNFFKNKDRVKAYILGGGIDFWWALIYIYIPIYLFENGFSTKIIGYFLGAIVIPLVLIEYPVGKFAGKKGFKKLFVLGYTILGIAALASFFMSNIYLILLILVLASFGAGMLESTTEAYFFDTISKKQRDKFYGSYNTTSDIHAFLGRALPATILLFLPFRSIFILFGVAMFIFAFISSRTKEIIENKR